MPNLISPRYIYRKLQNMVVEPSKSLDNGFYNRRLEKEWWQDNWMPWGAAVTSQVSPQETQWGSLGLRFLRRQEGRFRWECSQRQMPSPGPFPISKGDNWKIRCLPNQWEVPSQSMRGPKINPAWGVLWFYSGRKSNWFPHQQRNPAGAPFPLCLTPPAEVIIRAYWASPFQPPEHFTWSLAY